MSGTVSRPTATNQVPTAAISHRNVVGRVARSMTVFVLPSGHCQSCRNPMYRSRLRRKPEASTPPKTRIAGCASRYSAASAFMRSAHRCASRISACDCSTIRYIANR